MSDQTPAHVVTCTDEQVRGRPGTVARCSCSWSDAWGVRDGSAEASAHGHMTVHGPNYRTPHDARAQMTKDSRRKRIYDALLETLQSPEGAGSGLEARLDYGYGSEWLTVDGGLDLEHLTSDIIRWIDSGLAL